MDKTKDAGYYQCLVKDKTDTRNSATLNVIKILGANESFINITEPTGKYKRELSANQREVRWFVKYSGHPVPNLIWRDVQGNAISWSMPGEKSNSNSKFEATQDKRSTTLKIRNPQITDSGNYTLHADNGHIQKQQNFQLLVKGNL